MSLPAIGKCLKKQLNLFARMAISLPAIWQEWMKMAISPLWWDKDLIISGGLNVYPKEVEGLIDAIEGVVESAVIAAPHKDFGEAVVAVIVRQNEKLTEEDIQQSLQDRLAKFKQPKAVIFLDELPRNTMGKVQKAALRKINEKLFASA